MIEHPKYVYIIKTVEPSSGLLIKTGELHPAHSGIAKIYAAMMSIPFLSDQFVGGIALYENNRYNYTPVHIGTLRSASKNQFNDALARGITYITDQNFFDFHENSIV